MRRVRRGTQAITDVNAYIHTPVRKAVAPVKHAIEVDGVHSPVTSEPSSPIRIDSFKTPATEAGKASLAASTSLAAPLPAVPEGTSEASLGSAASATSDSTSESVARNWEVDKSTSCRSTPAHSLDGFFPVASAAPRQAALSFLDPSS